MVDAQRRGALLEKMPVKCWVHTVLAADANEVNTLLLQLAQHVVHRRVGVRRHKHRWLIATTKERANDKRGRRCLAAP